MSQYNIIPPKGKYTAVPQGYDTSYERFENLSDVGQGLGNILTGTMKGFGYDLEDPQSLLESLSTTFGSHKEAWNDLRRRERMAQACYDV